MDGHPTGSRQRTGGQNPAYRSTHRRQSRPTAERVHQWPTAANECGEADVDGRECRGGNRFGGLRREEMQTRFQRGGRLAICIQAANCRAPRPGVLGHGLLAGIDGNNHCRSACRSRRRRICRSRAAERSEYQRRHADTCRESSHRRDHMGVPSPTSSVHRRDMLGRSIRARGTQWPRSGLQAVVDEIDHPGEAVIDVALAVGDVGAVEAGPMVVGAADVVVAAELVVGALEVDAAAPHPASTTTSPPATSSRFTG
jgi:hypothetical protein